MSDISSEAPVRRGPGRPPLRPPQEEQRAPIRRRRRLLNEDKFALPHGIVPDGMSYEWKMHSVYGKEDPFYIQGLRENGWEPVDAVQHPELVPPGYKGAIIKDGQMLMSRPKELTEEATQELNEAARVQYRSKLSSASIRATADGGAPITNVKVKTSYERPAINIDE